MSSMARFRPIQMLGFAFATIIVLVLAAPTLRWLYLKAPDGALYGYTDAVPPRPHKIARAFREKTFQQWCQRYFDANMGFRKPLILSFNEITFRLFREAPRLRLYSTRANGLYSQMSIDSLNDEVSRRALLETRYQEEAQKLLRVQNLLQSAGKDFQVVIGASKPYVYPNDLGHRYLVGGSDDIYGRAASFGNALRTAGVNVVDGGPFLRDYVARTGVETHSHAGVHWNYYAACLVARQMFQSIHDRGMVAAPRLECGAPTLDTPHMIDVDGLDLLNIWSTGGVAKRTSYPKPTLVDSSSASPDLPKIVFISDSFADQIYFSLQQAHVYSSLIGSRYFKAREIVDPASGAVTATDVHADEAKVRGQVVNDIAQSNIVVLEMVDYNIQRWDYGFADYLLNYAANGGSIGAASASAAVAHDTQPH